MSNAHEGPAEREDEEGGDGDAGSSHLRGGLQEGASCTNTAGHDIRARCHV